MYAIQSAARPVVQPAPRRDYSKSFVDTGTFTLSVIAGRVVATPRRGVEVSDNGTMTIPIED